MGWYQYVRTGSSASSPALNACGVRQGSVLLYAADLISLIQGHGLNPNLYVDETQIYRFCEPSASLERQIAEHYIASCVDDVASWMRSNRLQLNTAKSEILWSATCRRSHQLPQLPFRVGTDEVTPAAVVRELGIYIFSDVSMRSHVTKTVTACFIVLRSAASAKKHPSIRPQISFPVAGNVTRLVTAGSRKMEMQPSLVFCCTSSGVCSR